MKKIMFFVFMIILLSGCSSSKKVSKLSEIEEIPNFTPLTKALIDEYDLTTEILLGLRYWLAKETRFANQISSTKVEAIDGQLVIKGKDQVTNIVFPAKRKVKAMSVPTMKKIKVSANPEHNSQLSFVLKEDLKSLNYGRFCIAADSWEKTSEGTLGKINSYMGDTYWIIMGDDNYLLIDLNEIKEKSPKTIIEPGRDLDE